MWFGTKIPLVRVEDFVNVSARSIIKRAVLISCKITAKMIGKRTDTLQLELALFL